MADVYVIRRNSSREDTTKGGRRGGQQCTLAEYLTTLGVLGHQGETMRLVVEVPKVCSTVKRSREKAERDSSRAQRFLRLISSCLAFYLGQTGIRLNALIKLLTSFGRLGGHRVSAGPKAGPFFAAPSCSLSFLSRHFGLRIVTRTSCLTIGVSCDRRPAMIRLLVKNLAKWNLTLYNECFGRSNHDRIPLQLSCSSHWKNDIFGDGYKLRSISQFAEDRWWSKVKKKMEIFNSEYKYWLIVNYSSER